MYESPGIPSTAVLAVLAQRYETKMDRPKVFGFWNGHVGEADRATLKLAIDSKTLPGEIEVALPRPREVAAGLRSYADVAEIVGEIVSTYSPVYVSVSSREYFPHEVFDDKPGVGWMLYLPKVVRRLMRQEGLAAASTRRRRYGSYRREITPAPENLINRDFRAAAPNQKWLTDITEFQIPAGKVYLSPVIDCFDGFVVSRSIGTRPDAELVNAMPGF